MAHSLQPANQSPGTHPVRATVSLPSFTLPPTTRSIMPGPVSDQVIVITGASSGIGLSTAKRAARQGARVVLAARNRRSLDAAVAGLIVAAAVAYGLMRRA